MKSLLLLVAAVLAASAASARAADLARPGSGVQRLARLEAPSARTHAAPGATAAAANPCLTLLPNDPAGAADDAQDWLRHGGGDPAAQCAALARVALGDPGSGAASLDALAQQPHGATSWRALLADEAAQAWLAAARPDRALASSTLAVSLDPDDPALLTDRARAALAAGHPEQAVADLSRVLSAHPGQAEAQVVRATAYRRLGRIDAARADIDAACTVLPDEPDALLERGILRERFGDLDGARSDWSRILSISPDTHEADLAQQDLALLEVGPEAR